MDELDARGAEPREVELRATAEEVVEGDDLGVGVALGEGDRRLAPTKPAPPVMSTRWSMRPDGTAAYAGAGTVAASRSGFAVTFAPR